MADIKITYETLFDLLRRERNREELQELEQSFYADVLTYLQEKQAITQGEMSANSEKARIQFQNIKRILKELYDRREKKLVLLALNTVRTGTDALDKATLLQEERLLFDELVTTFSRYRREVLESLLNRTTPFGGNAPVPQEIKPKTAPEPAPAPAEPEPAPRPTAPEPSPKPAGDLKIKFTKAVPRFAGVDEQVFGPFEAGDEASLPEKIAAILIKKGRAEQA